MVTDISRPYSQLIELYSNGVRGSPIAGQTAFVDGFEGADPSKLLHTSGGPPSGRYVAPGQPDEFIQDEGIVIEDVISWRNMPPNTGTGCWWILGLLRASNASSAFYGPSPSIVLGTPGYPGWDNILEFYAYDGQNHGMLLAPYLTVPDYTWVRMRVHVFKNFQNGSWYANVKGYLWPSTTMLFSTTLLIWDAAWGPEPGRRWQIAAAMWDGANDTFHDRTLVQLPLFLP